MIFCSGTILPEVFSKPETNDDERYVVVHSTDQTTHIGTDVTERRNTLVYSTVVDVLATGAQHSRPRDDIDLPIKILSLLKDKSAELLR